MKFKSILGTLIAFGAMALMAVGVQAATYQVGSVTGTAGENVTVPVQVKPDAGETVPVNAYAMSFTYNPQLATPVLAGQDLTQSDCYATVGTQFDGDKTVIVSDIISVSDTEAKLVVAWAAADPVNVTGTDAVDMASVEFKVAETATGSIPVNVTAATVASNATTVDDILENNLVSGVIDLADFMYGDIDNDKSVTQYDASLAAQYAVGLIELDADAIRRGNVDGDAGITQYDASLIAQYAVGLINSFPVENK